MTGTTMNNSLQEAIKPKMRNTNQREIFPCEMRDFCEREREIEGWEIPGRRGEREREGGHWSREGEREMWLLHRGKR
jgi:hypothetical protein